MGREQGWRTPRVTQGRAASAGWQPQRDTGPRLRIPRWDREAGGPVETLVHGEPVEAALKKATSDAPGALADLQKIVTQLAALDAGMKKDAHKWDAFKNDFAEMQIHLGQRENQANLAVRQVEKMISGGNGADDNRRICRRNSTPTTRTWPN